MLSRFYGLNEDENLDDIFDLNAPVVAPEYEYRSTGNRRNNQSQNGESVEITKNGRNASTHEQNDDNTNSQFTQRIHRSLNNNLKDNCDNNADSSDSQYHTNSETIESSQIPSNLSFHSLIRRNIIEPHQQQTSMIHESDNAYSIPLFLEDSPKYSHHSTNVDGEKMIDQFEARTRYPLFHHQSHGSNQPISTVVRRNETVFPISTIDSPGFTPFFGNTPKQTTTIDEGQNSQRNMTEQIQNRTIFPQFHFQSHISNNPQSTIVHRNDTVLPRSTIDSPDFTPFFGNTPKLSSIIDEDQNSQTYMIGQIDNPTISQFHHQSHNSNHLQSTMVHRNEIVLPRSAIDSPSFTPFFGNTPKLSSIFDEDQNSQTYMIGQIDNTTIPQFLHQYRNLNHQNIQLSINQTSDKQPVERNFNACFQPRNENSPFICSYQPPIQEDLTEYFQNFFGSYQLPEHIIANITSVPESILNLYKQIKAGGLSDWAFVHAISAQTCQEFTSMDCFVMLKTSLLLSIASIDADNERVPIPIIAIGKDCSSADSIMNHIGNFAQRFLAPTDQIFNVSIKPNKFVEIGPVFLAKNGVCYLGNWSGLTKNVSDEIKIIIGSGRYFLDKTRENFKLGSAIWTHCNSTKSVNKDYLNVAMFLKYFGIPIVMDSDSSDTVIEFILEEAMNGQIEIPNDALNICYDDMKTYLNIIRKIKIKTSAPAQLLLKSYFDAIRKDREDALSPQGSEIIQQMSESFAKMCLRDTVLVCDVIAVIAIVEKTMREIMGAGISPAPIVHNIRRIKEVDDYMKNFEKWVYDYIGMFNQTHT